MKRLSFRDGDEACEFCGNVEYDISETIITCTRCQATYGLVNSVWVVDSSQEKMISDLLTRREPFNSRETDTKEKIMEITDFETTLKTLADFYGVDIPDGFDGTELALVYRGDDCWHVGKPVFANSEDIENLTDEWAPRSDSQAQELYDYTQHLERNEFTDNFKADTEEEKFCKENPGAIYWTTKNGHRGLTERGAEVAEALGYSIDADSYGLAFARDENGDVVEVTED